MHYIKDIVETVVLVSFFIGVFAGTILAHFVGKFRRRKSA